MEAFALAPVSIFEAFFGSPNGNLTAYYQTWAEVAADYDLDTRREAMLLALLPPRLPLPPEPPPESHQKAIFDDCFTVLPPEGDPSRDLYQINSRLPMRPRAAGILCY